MPTWSASYGTNNCAASSDCQRSGSEPHVGMDSIAPGVNTAGPRSIETGPMLSIIIVNWNSLDYLCECLRSIFCGAPISPFEVIVVDNHSSEDPSIQILAKFPAVKVIRTATNLGFSAANNLGFRHSSGKYLLFLNPDTVILDSALSTLLSVFTQLPDAGILGCMLLNRNKTVQTSCVQRFPTILNQLLDFEFLQSRWPRSPIWGITPLIARSPHPAPVEVISGACLLIARDVFQQLGGFNETYFMYAEDVDLCYRARAIGRMAYYTGEAQVVHYGGGSSLSRNGNAWIAVMQRRAILQFCKHAHGGLYAAAYRASVVVAALARLFCLAFLRLLRPFFSQEPLPFGPASSKWRSVLRWGLGLNSGITLR